MTEFRRLTTEDLVTSRPVERAAPVPVIVLLDDVRSAHNVGLLFRLCDCVGVEALWLGGITPYPGQSERGTNRILKTGVGGSLQTVPWKHLPDPASAVRREREAGRRVIVAEQGEGAVGWRQAAYGRRSVLILGHERAGVRDSLLALADEVVSLPVRGITNSLNVATCASVLLYEILARHAATMKG